MDKGRGIFDPSSFFCVLYTVSRDNRNLGHTGGRKKKQKGCFRKSIFYNYKSQKEEKDMAQFYGEIKGQARTSATRRGSKTSGLQAHLRGWNIGVRVVLEYKDGIGDIIHIYRTSGSNGGDEDILIATLQDYN